MYVALCGKRETVKCKRWALRTELKPLMTPKGIKLKLELEPDLDLFLLLMGKS